MSYVDVDITVLGGLPVTVRAYIEPADREVGIFRPYIGDVEITHIAGKEKNTDWLLKRIIAVKGEFSRMLESVQTEADMW